MNYSIPFNEYMKNPYKKFGAVITKNQYAIEIGKEVHDWMIVDLINKIRPDVKTDRYGVALNENESFSNGNIILLGDSSFVTIELPHKELLSIDQFNYLASILLEIKKYNEIAKSKEIPCCKLILIGTPIININNNLNENNIDEIINELKKYIDLDIDIPNNEVILGISFNNKEVEKSIKSL